jgi:hypothetical protein
MVKNIQKINTLIIFTIILFSCASAPKASAPALYETPVRVSYESNDSLDNDNRMIAYSVSLELSVKDTENTRKVLIEQIKRYNGFIVRESEDSLTTRIPAENMDNFITAAKELGKVEDERKNGVDITDQYRDNLIRLESLKNVRARYLLLLEKANSVNDILSIEKELERINTEIELLEGRIKYAELSVVYSNITVSFKEKAKLGPVSWIFYGIYHGIKWFFVWG